MRPVRYHLVIVASRDEDFGDELTARWWLDHGDAERAARLLCPGQSVSTSESEHQELAAELGHRGLVCLREDGETWVWRPEDQRELEAEMNQPRASNVADPIAGRLDQDRRPPKREAPASQPSRRRHSS